MELSVKAAPKAITLSSANSITKPPVKSVMPTNGLFTPKPGGTVFGNAIRDIASSVSGGHFGQGEMKLKEGETDEQYQNRILQAVGTAAQSLKDNSSNSSNSSSMADSFKAGVTNQAVTNVITKYAPTVIIIGLGYWAAKKFIFNKGKKRSY